MSDPVDDTSPNDIAIVGMALRVPGARNTAEFWSNLIGGVESIRDLGDEELLAAGESPARMRLPNYVRRAAELPDMEMFDADFFGLSPKEAAIMDPQHRQFLECAWEAMEDAARTPEPESGPIGVFAGCGVGNYFFHNVCSNRQLVEQVGLFLLRHTGNDKDFLATRASFLFDLRGPSVNVQTACSSSLVAIHMAAQSLLAGECDMALAGGVTIELPHRRGYLFHDGEVLSPDGHCRPFDHRAAGTVFGSGTGVVALRRMADALADGDIIHGVIKSSAINNDGASKAGYLAPSVTGQAGAMIEAHGLAGISADTIGYVECHGTGTYLGDPIEVEALTTAFRQSTQRTGFCRIGSVKSNIGHLDTAAGVVGLIKAALVLKHGQIPPTLGFDKPNPAIDFARSPFTVAHRLEAWPRGAEPRRAAVNSLGVGGTNAHVVLEEPPAAAAVRLSVPETAPQLFVFSAPQRKALDAAMRNVGEALAADPDLALADVAHTLHAGRKAFPHRRVVAARSRDEAIAVLREPKGHAYDQTVLEPADGAVFLFPGGGAQHVGMARVLHAEDAQFRAIVEEGLASLPAAAAAEIRAVWFARRTAESAAAFLKPSVQLPATLIVEVAVARHLMRAGLPPVALIGHSMGENAAACISGVMSLKDAVNLVRLRGELFDTVAGGGMLSVPLSATALARLLPEALDLASVNAPELCVVSGLNADLEAFRATLAENGVDATRIAIDIAAHSRMLEPILARFEAFLRSIRLSAPAIPIVSNLTGTWLTDAEARDPAYWVRHLRSTVEFGKGIALLAEQPGRVFIEVGPGRTLSSLTKLNPKVTANQVINALPHADEESCDRTHLLAAVGRAWAVGLKVPLERLWPQPRRVALPTYPFQHQRYFIEPSAAAAAGSQEPDLRRVADMAEWGFRPTWRISGADFVLGADKTSRSFLIFLDDAGVGAALMARLQAGGHKVATVRVGDTFARNTAGHYVLCPEDGRAGYDALLAALAADGTLPDQIVHLWLTTADEAFRPGSSFFNRNQERGFYSLLHLAQALGDASLPNGLQVSVVGNGMQKVFDEPLPYPEKATVLGPGLVMPKEMPGIEVRLIDIPLPHPVLLPRGVLARRRPGAHAGLPAGLLDLLWFDLFAGRGSEVVAYRDGRRWARHYDRMPLAATDDPVAELAPAFRRDGVYLITGGMGDLALLMAEELVARYGASIVLVGRTPLPPRAEWGHATRFYARTDRRRRAMERMAAMEAAGGRVLYLPGDVSNLDEMSQVVAEARSAFGTINGVLHTAGVVDDDLMALKSQDRIEAVLDPKLHGTFVLDQVLAEVPLDLFVLFSSTSSDIAPVGQADYVAANAYLNAYADSRAATPGRRTIAVHWGVWTEIGMAARHVGGPQAPTAATLAAPAQGPFFSRWIEDGDGVPWLEADLSPDTHWVLSEHRMVSGQAVLPGTGNIEIIAQAAQEYGLGNNFLIENLAFLRPLAVDDRASVTVRVRLRPERGHYQVEIRAGESGQDASFVTTAEASIAVRKAHGPASDLLAGRAALPVARAPEGGALASVQSRHVRFGPRWQVLRSTAFGDGEAVAELALASDHRRDIDAGVRIHPALLDIATGFAMALAPAYAASDVLWVPLSYGRIRIFGPLPAEIVSRVRVRPEAETGDGYAGFDITIAGTDGTVAMEVERFVMKRLDDARGLGPAPRAAARPAAAPAEAASPAAQQLAAQVGQGIRPQEGFEALMRALASGEVQPIVTSLDLGALRQRATPAARPVGGADPTQFERPELESHFIAPRTPVEHKIAGFWSELLGVANIGVEDNFFDIGGHSLIAVRLFRMIKKEFSIDLPISALFDAPTIAGCAALVAEHGGAQDETAPQSAAGPATPAPFGAQKPVHVVTMSTGRAGRTPFFLCAGMYGNLLNLRQLALHIGHDRPVLGLQARGLFGDRAPHETFEEAARDYIAEIRAIRPRGPYLLGGFSGGGLIAYEIARQLREAGEEVSGLILLDTPLPDRYSLDLLDRIQLKTQDMRRHGRHFLSHWLEARREWGEAMRQRRDIREDDASAFHNLKIEAAFLRAQARYQVRPAPGRLVLFRPKIEVRYNLRGGRALKDGLLPALPDNGWNRYAAQVTVHEVRGDHDSMVLEPNVRGLADRLRAELSRMEAGESLDAEVDRRNAAE